MNPDPDLIDRVELANRTRLMEAIPHVAAYCYRADGVLLPPDLAVAECSPACSDYRAVAAGEIYSQGFRLPRTVQEMIKPLPPGAVEVLRSIKTNQGEPTEPPGTSTVFV
jgi:hypothetical protein